MLIAEIVAPATAGALAYKCEALSSRPSTAK
jgi:hypothetical protein